MRTHDTRLRRLVWADAMGPVFSPPPAARYPVEFLRATGPAEPARSGAALPPRPDEADPVPPGPPPGVALHLLTSGG